jgi:hypothetical protein
MNVKTKLNELEQLCKSTLSDHLIKQLDGRLGGYAVAKENDNGGIRKAYIGTYAEVYAFLEGVQFAQSASK